MQKREETFELYISYILIGGVILSLVAEVVGLLLYHSQTGSFNFDYTTQWQMSGENFFAYIGHLISILSQVSEPISLMALGIVLLMLTPYLRVIASVLYFARIKDAKYLLFTIFVLTVLTVSLIVH